MGEETIKSVLKNLGLTQKEAEVYIFLSKHGVLKGNEIAKGMKRHKAQIYRILKILEAKGLLESTLEAPARFTAVPFETVLDLSIKTKRDEAIRMEKARNEILTYWKSLSLPGLEPSPERFVVIEGSNRIYPKISQMIEDTRNQLSTVSTVGGLMRADQFGLFDTILGHPSRSKIEFRFLTDVAPQDLETMKFLLKKTPKTKFNFKGRNPDLGFQLAPRMVIRDTEEIIFFIRPRAGTSMSNQDDVCLWTNCKELVQAFSAVFDDLWRNSTDIEEKILELETGKPAPKICVISTAVTAKKIYEETLNSAKGEILMLTSATGLRKQLEHMKSFRARVERGVSVKIMAPITSKNLDTALKLSKYCAVRHAPPSHLATTIIDGQHLFQFKTNLMNEGEQKGVPCFEDTFYTSDREYVGKTQNMLNSIWTNAPVPSKVTLETILGSKPLAIGGTTSEDIKIIKKEQWFGTVNVTVDQKPLGAEKELLEKVLEYEKDPARTLAYASTGQVLVRPPSNVDLPKLMIDCWHVRRGTFGGGNSNTLIISLWLNTPKGSMYVPVAIVETANDLKILDFYRALFAGTPAEKNITHVTERELQVWRQGEGLFAGWTVQIPLQPLPRYLPPACLLFQRIGEARTQKYDTQFPSGYKGTCEYTGFDAFVTFISPSWKYAGPATEAVFGMDVIMTSIAPQKKQIN